MKQFQACLFAVILLAVSTPFLGAAPLFDSAVTYPVGSYPSSVFCADFDGDMDNDLAVTNFENASVSILLNNGDGTFAVGINYAVGISPSSVFASDLDGDGDRDLVTANFWAHSVSVLMNQGNATFAEKVDYLSSYPRAVFSSDLDNDGDQDLTTACCNGAYVYKNDGSGTFMGSGGSFVGWDPPDLFVSDFNRDGFEDLAMATIIPELASGSRAGFVSFLNNNGSGGFVFQDYLEFPASPNSVVAADVDGDSDQDLIVSLDLNVGTYVLRNDGSGVFADSSRFSLGGSDLFVADFDGDGNYDLAFADDSVVTVSLNPGNGDFGAGANFPAGSTAHAIFGSDLDGDGDKDLVVTNSSSSTVSVLRNLSNVSTNKGDLDRDASYTASDVVLMLTCAFLETGNCLLALADIDCDGMLTPSDIVIQLNLVFFGNQFSFPCI